MRALCAALAACVLLSACRPANHSARPDTVTLRGLAFPSLSYGPFFIADEEGYFREQGLQVDFVGMKRSADALPAVMQGALDFTGDFLGAGYLNAMARGSSIRFVADKGYIAATRCDAYAFVAGRTVMARGAFDRVARLRQRKVGVNARSVSGYLVDQLLSTGGLTLDDVEVVEIPTPALEQAMGRSIDMALMIEPAVSRAVQRGLGGVLATPQQLVPDFQLAYVLFGPNLLQENPEAGRRFMIAYLKAVRQFSQGKTERNLDILSARTGQDRELLRQACWPSFRVDGRINHDSIPEFQKWALKRGLIDTSLTVEQYWDGRFVDYANQALDGAPR